MPIGAPIRVSRLALAAPHSMSRPRCAAPNCTHRPDSSPDPLGRTTLTEVYCTDHRAQFEAFWDDASLPFDLDAARLVYEAEVALMGRVTA